MPAREQELEPNTIYGYRWLLSLLYARVGGVRASRLSARMVERAYRELEDSGYSRSTLRTLNLVLAKTFVEQTGRDAVGEHDGRGDVPQVVDPNVGHAGVGGGPAEVVEQVLRPNRLAVGTGEDQVEVVIVSGGELFCPLAAALPLECVDGPAGQGDCGR